MLLGVLMEAVFSVLGHIAWEEVATINLPTHSTMVGSG